MTFVPILFLAIATYTDIKEKKIKNSLTYSLILLGLIVSSYKTGYMGSIDSMGGIVIALLVVSQLPGFRHGGGDIKLAMGIGSFLGISKIMYFLFFWFLLSLLVCNFKLIRNKGFQYFKNILWGEIILLGNVKEEKIVSTVGAPIMLVAYLVTLIYKG